MNWIKEITNDKALNADLQSFYDTYGTSGLKQAIELYTDMQQKYICKTRTSTSQINIGDIYYLEIKGHDISVHTAHDKYHKYGTLNKELEFLAPFGFLKCSQSVIISLHKIQSIVHDDIILINGTKIHISRNYTAKILLEFSRINKI